MILYRGEIENNKFIYGHPYQENGEDFIISKGVITNKVITNSLMPYTGWKDKNGTKIFQSDTIKGFITKGEKTQEFIYQVVWKYSGFYVKSGSLVYLSLDDFISNCKGEIYVISS